MGEVPMWPPSLLPQQWDITNYRDSRLQYPMAPFLWNGVVVAALTTVGTLSTPARSIQGGSYRAEMSPSCEVVCAVVYNPVLTGDQV
jgi:hypothetical protein